MGSPIDVTEAVEVPSTDLDAAGLEMRLIGRVAELKTLVLALALAHRRFGVWRRRNSFRGSSGR